MAADSVYQGICAERMSPTKLYIQRSSRGNWLGYTFKIISVWVRKEEGVSKIRRCERQDADGWALRRRPEDANCPSSASEDVKRRAHCRNIPMNPRRFRGIRKFAYCMWRFSPVLRSAVRWRSRGLMGPRGRWTSERGHVPDVWECYWWPRRRDLTYLWARAIRGSEASRRGQLGTTKETKHYLSWICLPWVAYRGP